VNSFLILIAVKNKDVLVFKICVYRLCALLNAVRFSSKVLLTIASDLSLCAAIFSCLDFLKFGRFTLITFSPPFRKKIIFMYFPTTYKYKNCTLNLRVGKSASLCAEPLSYFHYTMYPPPLSSVF
jgi:hypothetical protein